MMSTSDLSDDEVVPASPASVELENVNFPMAMLNIDFDKENAKKKRLRKNAQNSKSNLIRGVCKKALGLTINPRMDLDAFVLVRDNESKSVTIVGSEEFMSNFKENKCLMACSQKKIFTYNLDQLNLVKKPAVPPSPQNLPKEMASFTPGSQQVYNLQNAALTRGASPLINITSDNSRNINSGIVGRVSAKRKALIPAPQKVR